MIPLAPFQEEMVLETDALLVLNPNSPTFFMKNNPGTLLYGTDVLNAKGAYNYTNNPVTTTPFGIYVITSGITIKNIDNSGEGTFLIPNTQVLNTTAKTLTEEVIITNKNLISTVSYIGIQVPDNLADTSMAVWCYTGSGYELVRTDKLNGTWSNVSVDTTKLKFLDGTKVDDVYGVGLGRGVYPKGKTGQTVTGSIGTLTYSNLYPTYKRVGKMITLPASGGAAGSNQIRLKFIITYIDTVSYNGTITPTTFGQIYTPTTNATLKNIDGTSEATTLQPNTYTNDTMNRIITEEVIITNNASGTVVIDSWDVAPGNWAGVLGSNFAFSSVGGRLRVTGKTDANKKFTIRNNVDVYDFSTKDFITYSIESSLVGTQYLKIVDTSNNEKVWGTGAITANTPISYVHNLKASNGSTSFVPSSLVGTLNYTSLKFYGIGIVTTATAGSDITIYLDNLCVDSANPVYVEMQVPEILDDQSLTLQYWNGTQYENSRIDKLNSTYSNLVVDSTKAKFLDGNLIDDCYGVGLGRAIYPKGVASATVIGSLSTMTYSNNLPASKRIGLLFNLPPAIGATGFNQVRLKFILNYTCYSPYVSSSGMVGQLFSVNSGVTLKNIDNSNEGAILFPSTRTLNTTTHVLTEEFTLSNNNPANTPTVITGCNTNTTGWNIANGDAPTTLVIDTSDKTEGAGSLSLTANATTGGAGAIVVKYTFTVQNWQAKEFLTFDFKSTIAGTLYVIVHTTSTEYKYWSVANAVTTSWKHFVIPLNCLVSTMGCSFITASYNPASITQIEIGVTNIGVGNAGTIHIDNICVDVGKYCTVEVNIPDYMLGYLEESRIRLLTWNGTQYNLNMYFFGPYSTDGKLDGEDGGGYYLDGSTAKGVFGTASDYTQHGVVAYKRGKIGENKTKGTYFDVQANPPYYVYPATYTYSNLPGTSKRLAFMISMPPVSDNYPLQSKMQMKLDIYYADSTENTIADLSGNALNGTLNFCMKGTNNIDLTGYGNGWIDTGLKIQDLGSYFRGKFIFDFKFLTATEGFLLAIPDGVESRYFYIYNNLTTLSVRTTDGSGHDTTNLKTSLQTNTIYTLEFEYNNGVVTADVGGTHTSFTASHPIPANATTTSTFRIGGVATSATTKFDGRVYYAKVWNVDTGKGFEYNMSFSKFGLTSTDFSSDANKYTGLLNIAKPLIGWNTTYGVEFYVFDRKLVLMKVKEDETGKVWEVDIGATKGTKIYHGYVSHANKLVDANADKIPDVIPIIESMCKRVGTVQ